MNENGHFRKGYHDLLRPEILERIPLKAKKILDFGCGTGALGKAVKERQNCIFNGVELDDAAAEQAQKVLDTVYVHNLNMPRPKKYGAKYDCMIFADILEHVINPGGMLKHEIENLTQDGIVIASIPNVAHASIIKDLTFKLWRYSSAGILDITHIRFFTKMSMCQMFAGCGLKIKLITGSPTEGNPIQYIITAKPMLRQATKPVVTLLMPVYNAYKYTRLAIESIFEHTKTPFKLIVIDNGSTDGTTDSLRNDDRFLHLESPINLGFPMGINQGLSLVDTEYFAILNNDIIVTEGWLERLIKTMNTDPKIAIVGPRTNYVSGPQADLNARYHDLTEMHEYAKNFKEAGKESIRIFFRIVFFCTLLKSELLQKIGCLDELFGMGNFEDDDYCRRANLEGYKTAIDDSVFIHHYGSKSFVNNGIDYKKLMTENQEKFKKKWGL